MRAIELLADRPELTLLELAHREAAPPVGRPDDGRVHELQHGTLAEGVRDDLGATALFEEEPLEQVGGTDNAPMAEREAEVGEAVGRGYYDSGAAPGAGYRNGYRRGRLRSAEGAIEYGVPQVADRAEPFVSRVRGGSRAGPPSSSTSPSKCTPGA